MSSEKFNFVSKFPIAVIFSLVMVLTSLLVYFQMGLNYGVDFRGGAEIQVRFNQGVPLDELRASIGESGITTFSVQTMGKDDNKEFLIKVSGNETTMDQTADKISALLRTKYATSGADILKTDIVGPKAGERLRNSGFQALVWAVLGIMVYIGLRFDFRYSPGAVIALIHDVIIVVGVFAITGKEFSLQIVGALLAIIGYSVNDTVVVYDRLREVEAEHVGNLAKAVNIALNETLTRTILTSATTLFVSFTMFALGGGTIKDFFFAFTLGVVVGTYSSIFIAAPITMFLDKFYKKNEMV